MKQSDPLARGVIVASFAVALYATFAAPGMAVPEAQAQQVIIIATPTLGVPEAPPAASEPIAVRAAVPTPVAEQAPAAEPAPAVVVNEESRPAEHVLPPVQPAPPAVQEPKAGDVLLQASDAASWANVTTDEGSKPGRAWRKP